MRPFFMKSYASFYPRVLERLQKEKSFSSREEAFNWLRQAWLTVYTEAGADKHDVQTLKTAQLSPEHGWHDMDKEACYLDSPESPRLRLYLHRDGSIVLQQMQTETQEILFAKPGKTVHHAL